MSEISVKYREYKEYEKLLWDYFCSLISKAGSSSDMKNMVENIEVYYKKYLDENTSLSEESKLAVIKYSLEE